MDVLPGGEDCRNIEVETADDRVVLVVLLLLWAFPHTLFKGIVGYDCWVLQKYYSVKLDEY